MKNRIKKLSIVMMVSGALCFPLSAQAQTKETAPSEESILVGVNYFAGWRPLPNKYVRWIDSDGKDWREYYPGTVSNKTFQNAFRQ